MIKIYNEDCIKTMSSTLQENSVDVVITSPPYNNSRTSHTEYCMKTANCRYEEYNDNKTNEEYCDWICEIFHGYNRILKENGVVLFNISYGSENPNVLFECLHNIITRTQFMCADIITWKKKSALPNNVSKNKLTRICEYVFVFCRKNEYDTFSANKIITSVNERTKQPFYSVLYNFIEADNNDFANELNKATFSTEFVIKLLDMYGKHNGDFVVYDSFMGTGTTAVACKIYGVSCYGSEISKKQCEYAENRLKFNNSNCFTKKQNEQSFEKFSFDI